MTPQERDNKRKWDKYRYPGSHVPLGNGYVQAVNTTGGQPSYRIDINALASRLPRRSLQCFKVQSESYDWVVCKTWNGEEEGTTSVKVAKPYLLQKTPAVAAERNGYTYTQSAANERTSTRTSDSDEVTEYITPPYVAGDLIWAEKRETFVLDGETKIIWQDTNLDARTWCE